MESFCYSAPEERQYATYKSDPEWRRIYSFLHHGYWHGTTPNNWKAILASGVIRPRMEGDLLGRWWSKSTERSYAYNHRCVALFDFVSPSEEEVIETWDRAWETLTNIKATTILLRLDRRRLRSRIIPNSQGWPRAPNGEIYFLIPFCEVWYPEDIPTIAISQVYELLPPSKFGELNCTRIAQ